MKKIIIIGVAVLVLVGAGVGAYLMLGSDDPDPAALATAGAEGAVEAPAAEPEGDPIYLPLSPAFVVNFDHNGNIRYLQLTLEVMAYDQAVIDKVEANLPAVRNTLIMLFSGQDYDGLNTAQGKEKLRQDVRTSSNERVKLKDANGIADGFFTACVIQ